MDKNRKSFSSFATKFSNSLGISSISSTDDSKDLANDPEAYNVNLEIYNIQPKLKLARERAYNLLENSVNNKTSNLSGITGVNRELLKSNYIENFNVPRENNSINISDLIAEKTIVLESPLKSTEEQIKRNDDISGLIQNKISFEPSEMTGRSTLSKPNLNKDNVNLSVNQILASSFCENIRRMTLETKNSDVSINSLYTADITNSSKSDLGSFRPGELMQSQMLRDELSWENEYLPIPSNQAIEHEYQQKGLALQSSPNEKLRNSDHLSNISELDNYFNKRSDRLDSIVDPNLLSPPKKNPVKLVADESIQSPVSKNDPADFSPFARTTYTRTPINKINKKIQNNKENQKVLTISAVENIFKQLNIDDYLSPENKTKLLNSISERAKIMEIGKENIGPEHNNVNVNDTVTFSESMLDDSSNCINGKKSSNLLREAGQSTLTEVRSDKTPLKNSDASHEEKYANQKNSRKRFRSSISLTPEPHPIMKPLCSTLLNDNKEKDFLSVDVDLRPPLSPIRTKFSRSICRSLTPDALPSMKSTSPLSNNKNERNFLDVDVNTTPLSSKFKTPTKKTNKVTQAFSPRIHSESSSESQRSPISLDTTTQSERRYLCINDDKGLNSNSPGSKLYKSKTNSPVNMFEPVTRQYSAGSLLTAKSRCNSQCSTSSEFTHKVGQSLPIKATINQCCFGSTKLRTVKKSVVGIRNSSLKRLAFKISIEGPGFQIENIENNSIVTLQGLECRSFVITFGPTVLGAAIGRLNFSSPYDGWPVDKVILLQGFGGHASIKVLDFYKGPSGLPFINMGEVQDLSKPLIRSFSVYNRGPLAGFAMVNLNSNGLPISKLCDRITVKPLKAYIPPDSSVKFNITFQPSRVDIKKILLKITDVMTIANIQIITGDDATRQRIRNIVKTLDTSNSNEKSSVPELTDSKISTCWTTFPNEINLKEINDFIENSEHAIELTNDFRCWEAVLTITHCLLDSTKSSTNLVLPNLDETIFFRTMLCANSNEKTISEFDFENNRLTEPCLVKPNILRFDRPEIIKTKFSIHSFFENHECFEVTSNYKNLFDINPKDGEIKPGEILEVEVGLIQRVSGFKLENVNVIVFFEKEKINIPVIF